MPREIKTTIAVDGEAAFKRAINEANTSIRNMGSQLTLATAQFKKDGDAMKLVESRSKALNGQIGQQEEIVKALEKALADSTKAYGANSEKTEKWEAELNRAKAKLVNLQNELTLNNQGLDRSGKAFDEGAQKAADYEATLKGIGKNVSFQAITEGLGGVTGAFEGAVQKVLDFARVIRESFADAGKWADDLLANATKWGMDVETLQAWEQAADFIDTDVETIMNAQQKVTTKMKKGWKDGKIDIWQLLGIDIKNKSAYDVMWEAGETLMNMAKVDGNTIRADQYSLELFGKSWRDMIPLFTAGREEWEKTVAEQQVVSEDRVKALGELDDANNALENSWNVTKYSFLADLAPTITLITEKVTELLQAFNAWMDTDEGKQAMQDLSDAIKSLFEGLGSIEFSDVMEKVKNAINDVKKALVWVKNHKESLKVALEVIGAGFAAIKVAELATNLGRIVNSFTTLWNGANKPLPTYGTDPTNGTNPALPTTQPTAPTTGAQPTAPTTQPTTQPTAPSTGTQPTTPTTGTQPKTPTTQPTNPTTQPVDTATGGGAAATLSALFAKFTAGGGAGLASALFWPAAIITSLAVAVGAQKGNEADWINQYESNENLATLAGKNGYDASRLLQMNRAVGPKSDGNGGYQRGWFGFLNMSPTSERDYVLAALNDPIRRSKMYSDFMTYGDRENDNVLGWKPWTMAERYMGIGDYGNMPLENNEVDAFVEYMIGIERKKIAAQLGGSGGLIGGSAVTGIGLGTEAGSTLYDIVSELNLNTQAGKQLLDRFDVIDLKKFNGMPTQMEAAAERGTRRGVSGINVVIDGQAAGRIMAPYINAELGKSAQ